MLRFSILHRLPLAGNIITALLVVNTVLLSVFGACFYRWECNERFNEVKEETRALSVELASRLSHPVLTRDLINIRRIVDDSMKNDSVVAVNVWTEASRPLYLRRNHMGPVSPFFLENSEGEPSPSIRLDIKRDNKILGSVEVCYTLQHAKEAIRKFLVAILLGVMLTVISQIAILYAMIRRLVILPVMDMERYARLAETGEKPRLSPPAGPFAGELEGLRRSLVSMVVNLRQSERRYRSIFENSVEGMYQTSVDGRVLSANPAVARILGYSSPVELMCMLTNIGQQLYVNSEDRAEVVRKMKETGFASGHDVPFYRKDGSVIYVSLTLRAVRDDSGMITCFEGSLIDVSARKKAEAEMACRGRELENLVEQRTRELVRKNRLVEQVNERLRETDAVRTAFLNSVAHELRTPLTSILGFVALIQKEFAKHFMPLCLEGTCLPKRGKRLAENIAIIKKEGERLTRLINDFLDLAKIESGRLEWRDQESDLLPILKRAVDVSRGAFASNPAITLSFQAPSELPSMIVDPDRLIQVVANLLSNAAKFTEAGKVSVDVRVKDGALRVSVVDTGPGIPEQDLRCVFESFHQVSRNTREGKERRGTGLGLAICKQIVEHYDGKIWVESEPGKGSAFIFTLPLSKSSPESTSAKIIENQSHPRESQPSAPHATPRPEVLRNEADAPVVLVVEDDVSTREYLTQILRQEGYVVCQAVDGQDAVAKVQNVAPNLVLTDINMPNMDGVAAIRVIRETQEGENLPVLALSSESDKGRWVEAFAVGANDFIPKPCEQRELLARVATHLRLANLTLELKTHNCRLRQELYLASQVQQRFLPSSFDFEGVSIATHYQPNDAVGGDFFDVWEEDDSIYFLIGDIAGHDTASALLMALCKGIVSSLAHKGLGPEAIVSQLNRLLYEVVSTGDIDLFSTMCLANLDLRRNTLKLISAGHPTVYLTRNEACVPLESTGPAIGLMPEYRWKMHVHHFGPGDMLFMYTDGLIEVRNTEKEFFGSHRVQSLVTHRSNPGELVTGIIAEANKFSHENITDDLSILAVRRNFESSMSRSNPWPMASNHKPSPVC